MQTSDSVWTSKLSKYYYGCSDPSNSFMSKGSLKCELVICIACIVGLASMPCKR